VIGATVLGEVEGGPTQVKNIIDFFEQGSGIDRVIIKNVLIDFLDLY